MNSVSTQEFEQNPAAILRRLEAGEHIAVVRDGQRVAELHPVFVPRPGLRPIGLAAGEFVVPDDFDAPLPEDILRDFEGRRSV